jgi:probable F420-dependent oxidoreductase
MKATAREGLNMTVELGAFGIWQTATLTTADMAAQIEHLGFTTLWVGGPNPDLAGIDELLEATESLVVGTSILNIWHGDPAVAATAYHRLTNRFPGRFVLGIGAGHREHTQQFAKPLTALERYLDGLDTGGVPIEGRMLAALGPKTLELAADRTGGAVPYLVTPEHTRIARKALGTAKLLAPEHKVVLNTDPQKAREIARPRIRSPYLGLKNYTNNLRRLGFTDEDLTIPGSDRLIDALVAHGDAQTIADTLSDHRKAGADHIAIQVLGTEHVPHPDLPDVQIPVYGEEIFVAYHALAHTLYMR